MATGCGKHCPVNGHLFCERHDPVFPTRHYVLWPSVWPYPKSSRPTNSFRWDDGVPLEYWAWEPNSAGVWDWKTYVLACHVMPSAGQRAPVVAATNAALPAAALPAPQTAPSARSPGGCGKQCAANSLLTCDYCSGSTHYVLWPMTWAPGAHTAFFWRDSVPGRYWAWELNKSKTFDWIEYAVPSHSMPGVSVQSVAQGGTGQGLSGKKSLNCGKPCPAEPSLLCDNHSAGDPRVHYKKWVGKDIGYTNGFHWDDADPNCWEVWEQVPGSSWYDWVKHYPAPAVKETKLDVAVSSNYAPIEEDDLYDASPTDFRRVAWELDERGDLVPRERDEWMLS
jgi:hypothetical protein